MADVLASPPRRSRRWVAATVALVVLGTAAALLLTRRDEVATIPAQPVVGATPSATATLDPRAMIAPAYAPGRRVDLYVRTFERLAHLGATREDVTFGAPAEQVVPLAHGYAAITARESGPEQLVLATGDRRVVRTLTTGRHRLVPGAGDDVWTVELGDRDVHRWDRDGNRGPRVRLPVEMQLVRGTVAGLLLESAAKDEGPIVVWDPARRRVVRTLARRGFYVSTGPRYVVWQSTCAACRARLYDVVTGTDRPVPQPPAGHGWMWRPVVAADGSVAYATDGDGTPPEVWVAGPHDTAPRLVARAIGGELVPAWLAPGRLAIVQQLDGYQTLVYGWEGGVLRRSAAYDAVPGGIDFVMPG